MGHSSAPLSWPLLFLSFVRWPGTRVLGSTPERQALGQGGSVSPGWGVISRRPTEGQVAQLPEVPGLRCWAPRQARPCALVISAQAQSGCIFASRLRECKCPGAPAAQPLVNHTCGLQPVLRPPLQLTGPLGTNPCTVSLTLSLTRLPPPTPTPSAHVPGFGRARYRSGLRGSRSVAVKCLPWPRSASARHPMMLATCSVFSYDVSLKVSCWKTLGRWAAGLLISDLWVFFLSLSSSSAVCTAGAFLPLALPIQILFLTVSESRCS